MTGAGSSVKALRPRNRQLKATGSGVGGRKRERQEECLAPGEAALGPAWKTTSTWQGCRGRAHSMKSRRYTRYIGEVCGGSQRQGRNLRARNTAEKARVRIEMDKVSWQWRALYSLRLSPVSDGNKDGPRETRLGAHRPGLCSGWVAHSAFSWRRAGAGRHVVSLPQHRLGTKVGTKWARPCPQETYTPESWQKAERDQIQWCLNGSNYSLGN